MNTQFIAEVSSNHNRDLTRCLEMIDVAAEVGCSAIKFQLFRVDSLFAPEILENSPEHRQRREWELPLEFIPRIAERCRDAGIRFGCTPFYLEAVDDLEPYVDFLKIASYEILWTPLAARCAAIGKPVMISTGMARFSEVEAAVAAVRAQGNRDLSLLHCVSGYPVPVSECNLAAIGTLRKRFNCPTGWSDHSAEPAVILRAVHRWRADLVEFHLDLDRRGFEYSLGHCWLPQEIQRIIGLVHSGLEADGSGIKEPAAVEAEDRSWRADPEDGLRPLKEIREDWKHLEREGE